LFLLELLNKIVLRFLSHKISNGQTIQMNQNSSKRHIIIGDIHGCINELEKLLKKIHFRPDDSLYFLGDLIDKGPDSVNVVKKVYELSLKHNTKLIFGNHEEKFFRFLKKKENNNSSLQTMTNTEEFEKLALELTKEEINFLMSGCFYFRIEKINIFLVHAGIPDNTELDPTLEIRFGDRFGKELKKLRLLTMTRMLNKNGSFLGLNQTEEGMYFWAEKYDGKYGRVIFGHQPYINNKVHYFPNAVGIDTGCVFGGALTAILICENLTEMLIQEPAEKKYCL
jgi:hypothetical protein